MPAEIKNKWRNDIKIIKKFILLKTILTCGASQLWDSKLCDAWIC
jgi:hypothetical protein